MIPCGFLSRKNLAQYLRKHIRSIVVWQASPSFVRTLLLQQTELGQGAQGATVGGDLRELGRRHAFLVRELDLDQHGLNGSFESLRVGVEDVTVGVDLRTVRQLSLGQGGVEDLDGGSVEAVGLPGPDEAVRVDLDDDLSDDPRAAVLGGGGVGLLDQLDRRVAELVRHEDDVELAVQAPDAAVRGVEDPLGDVGRVDGAVLQRDDRVATDVPLGVVPRDDVHLFFSSFCLVK